MGWLAVQSDALRIPLPDQSVDLVFGSPPYCDARTYGINAGRKCREWVEWMLRATTEALRVSRGAVVWVGAGVTRDHSYWPACEGLMWEWYSRGGSLYRPCYWHRFGIPGSGGKQWFRSDIEYVMAFKRPGELLGTDNTAMGKPPKFGAGGAVSHRTANGVRVANGRKPLPSLANPGNLISTGAGGGGHLGHPLAHKNEAPFPERLAEHFIRSLCPPGGVVLDPFGGSGTTADVARKNDRVGLSFDIRRSQAELATRRIAE